MIHLIRGTFRLRRVLGRDQADLKPIYTAVNAGRREGGVG